MDLWGDYSDIPTETLRSIHNLKQQLKDERDYIKTLHKLIAKTTDQRVRDEIKAREDAVALANAQANELSVEIRKTNSKLLCQRAEFRSIIDHIEYSAWDSAGEVFDALDRAFKEAYAHINDH